MPSDNGAVLIDCLHLPADMYDQYCCFQASIDFDNHGRNKSRTLCPGADAYAAMHNRRIPLPWYKTASVGFYIQNLSKLFPKIRGISFLKYWACYLQDVYGCGKESGAGRKYKINAETSAAGNNEFTVRFNFSGMPSLTANRGQPAAV